eukprot:GSChrysophyteH1.ASY1.ANO1.353.1 assembled CDS
MAQYVRLIVHRPHRNSVNLFEQAGIVAINIRGFDPEDDYQIKQSKGDFGLQEFATNGDIVLEDGVIDVRSRRIIQRLALAKADAVKLEDFDQAKLIKVAQASVVKAGHTLVRLDRLKKEAVKAEDFDYAKEVKMEGDKVRAAVDEEIMSLRLHDMNPHKPPPMHRAATQVSANVRAPDYLKQAGMNSDPSLLSNRENEQISPPANEFKEYKEESPFSARKIAAPYMPAFIEQYEDIDEPASPVSVGGDRYNITEEMAADISPRSAREEVVSGPHPLEGVPNYRDLPEPEPWSSEFHDEAERSGIIQRLGDYRARCAYSKAFVLREAVLLKTSLLLTQHGQQVELPPLRDCLGEVCSLLCLLMEDKIHQVIMRAVGLLEDVLSLVQTTGINRTMAAPLLESILVILMRRLADGNHRLRELARVGVDCFVNSSVMGPLTVGIHAMRSLSKNELRGHAWRPLVSRLILLRDLVDSFGLDSDLGLSLETVMNFPKNSGCFSHSNGEVRDAAKELTIAVERHTGVVPLSAYLQALRPKQLQDYNESFERAAAGKAPQGPYNKNANRDREVSPRYGPGKPGYHAPRNVGGRVEFRYIVIG